MQITDLLLHPVRLRIVQATFDGEPTTTQELHSRLPDVPRPTLYRHIALLVQHDVLELVREEPVRGVQERYYQLRHSRARIDHDEAESMSVSDHRRGFVAATASLLAEFELYLSREDADPLNDSVSYKQYPLLLTPSEKAALIEDLVAVITPRLQHHAMAGRQAHLFSTIFFPVQPPTLPYRDGCTT